MQHAVKLALVDPNTINNNNNKNSDQERRHREYRDLGKQPGQQAKADLSIEMKEILREQSIPDDVKLKLYNQALHRFLTVDKAAATSADLGAINWSAPPAPPPLAAQSPAASAAAAAAAATVSVKKKAKKARITLPPSPAPSVEFETRKSRRTKQPPPHLDWVSWAPSK